MDNRGKHKLKPLKSTTIYIQLLAQCKAKEMSGKHCKIDKVVKDELCKKAEFSNRKIDRVVSK